ncbi:hypothetical protein SCOR_07390 [Sulfidibacter corallicola]|uniref:Alginate export domain-containing protein n=1 Tax=Sulfidibacter corallicola TaxID=2818388 RepID=A0A8A4TPD6_SULCO|nr:hypothetical protein [Sulfidibacter corallicola]QTD51413.1 hypothetical protein J3U87_02995 [Sulfidibacter corallicola]
MKPTRSLPACVLILACLITWPLFAGGSGGDHQDDGHSSSRLTDEHIPLRPELVPDRPPPLIEWGEPFLGTGTLAPGFELGTGAVWQPSLYVFGTLRAAVQSNGYNAALGDARVTEAAARLDLFANLQLSGSERLVLGFRNLDQDGSFTRHVFDSEVPTIEDGSESELNADIRSLFFEGDFGEIFPNLSPRDFKPLDIGFSIGRQPLFFQEGILVNDSIDGVGLTWNSLQPRKTANYRTTFFYGWDNVDRNNLTQHTGDLIALFTAIDYKPSTVEVDVAYSLAEDGFDDMMAFGISAIQRLGLVNSSFRVLGSRIDDDNDDNDGYLLFSELSWTPHHTHDLAYVTTFWAIDTYTPIASGSGNGGALARAGISYAGVSLANYGAPLSPTASNVAGAALGYQKFMAHNRQQLLVEVASRFGTRDSVTNEFSLTTRYQAAFGRRFVVVLDGFANLIEAFDREAHFGARLELQVRF